MHTRYRVPRPRQTPQASAVVSRFAAYALGVALSGSCWPAAWAASGTWSATTGSPQNWSTAADWTSSIVADGAGFTANFTSNITGSYTVNLDTSRTIGSVVIGDSTPSNAFTLATGANTLTFDNGSSNAALTQNGNGSGDTVSGKLAIGGNGTLVVSGSRGFSTFTVSAGITSALASGTQTLNINNSGASHSSVLSGVIADGSSGGKIAVTKTNSGTATLSGNNTYTGGTTLSAGTLNINSANALGSGALTIGGGAFNNTTGAAITLATNNAQNWNGSFAFGGTRALDLGTGAVVLGANVTATVGGTGASALTVGGNISGAGRSLTKAGNGTLILGGNNTYDGGTVVNAGVLQFNSSAAIGGSGQNVTVNNGGTAAFGFALDQATLGRVTAGSGGSVALGADSSNNLDFGASGLAGLSLGAAGGAWTYGGSLWTPTDGTYRLGGGGGTLIFAPALTGSNGLLVGGGGSGGKVTLVNAGTYSGPTVIVGGVGSTSIGATNGASLLQTNVLAGASTTPFGVNSSITLNNGGLGLGTAGTLGVSESVNAVGYDVGYKGANTLSLSAGSGTVGFAANSFTRIGNGVLILSPTSGATLGVTEKVTVSSGVPVVTNGMVAPYYVNGTTKNFLTYDPVDGFKDVVPDKTGTNALPAAVAATDNILINESGNNTSIASFGNLVVNSLRIFNSNSSNGTQTLGASTDTLTIQSGGLITNWSAGGGNTFSGATINFGNREAVVGVFGVSGGTTFSNLIIGSGGFTTYGTQSLTIGNLQTTGGVTIAGGSTMLVSGNGTLSINPNNILTVERGGTFGMNANNRPSQFTGLEGEGSINWTSSTGGNNAGTNAFTIDGLTGTGTTTFSGVILDSSGYTLNVAKTGLTTQVLSGANSYSGTTTVNGGVLRLDFSAGGAPAADILNNAANASALVLGGGKLDLVGGAGENNSQRFNGLTVNAGNSAISLAAGAGGGVPTVDLGSSLTRNTGGTLNVTDAVGGNVTTTATTTLTNGVLSASASNPTAFATVNGTDWATYASGIKAISSYATGNANYTTTNNIDVTNGDSVSGVTVNSLRFNSASTALTLAGTNTVNTGGILVTSAATAASITGGTLKSGTGNELVIVNNGLLAVDSVLANGSGASALTLSGSGTTTLNGNNTFTGNTFINSGTVVAGHVNAFGTAGTIQLNGGTLAAGSALTIGRAVALANNSVIGGSNDLTLAGAFTNSRNFNTLTVNNSGTTTLSGTVALGTSQTLTVAGTGNVVASGVVSGTTGGLTYAGTGTLTLSNAANTYTGATRVTGGTVSVGTLAAGGAASGIGQSTNAAANLVLDGGTFKYTGATVSTDRLFSVGASGGVLDASGSGAVTFANAGTIGFANAPGARTLTLAGTNADANTLNSVLTDAFGFHTTSLSKNGTGRWVLGGVNTYSGDTLINAGTLALGASGAISANSAITVAAGATFDTTAQSYVFSTAKTTTIGVGATSAGLINSAAVTFSNANLGFDFGSTSTLLASYTVLVKTGFTGDFNSVVATGTSISGTFLNAGSGNWTLTSGGYDLTFSQTLGTLTAVASAVPEPSAYAALAGMFALAGAVCRRRGLRR